MKKLFLFFTLLCFVTTAATAAPVIVNGVLLLWTDASGDIVIPDEVTMIAENVFKDNQNITSVSGGANVTSIGSYCFVKTKIHTIEFPKVETISYSAFENCYFLETVSFPLVTLIRNNAFSYCTSLNSISFPEVITISERAFYSNTSLTTAIFPKATTIGRYAFYDNSSLISASFPLVKTMDYSAFEKCTSLTTINFPLITNIADSGFSMCTSLISAYFPEVTFIASTAFYGNSSLTTINFPKATIISRMSFAYCSNLTTVLIPKASIINDGAFALCIALKIIDLPKTITIGNDPFSSCYLLEKLNLPEIQKIGVKAFINCVSLKDVDCSTATKLSSVDATAFPTTLNDLTITVSDVSKIALFPPEADRQYKVVSLPGTSCYINLLCTPSEGGTVSGSGVYEKGTSITIKAIPNADYDFLNWTQNGEVVSTSTNYTFDVTENKEFTANFVYSPKINVSILPSENGTIQVFNNTTEIRNGDLVPIGKKIRVFPLPAEGYKLEYLEIDNTIEVSASFIKILSTELSSVKTESIMTIFPNPAENNVLVQLVSNANVNNISVYDSNGKIIEIVPVYQSSAKFNVNNYTKGIYYIKAGNETRKLIVK